MSALFTLITGHGFVRETVRLPSVTLAAMTLFLAFCDAHTSTPLPRLPRPALPSTIADHAPPWAAALVQRLDMDACYDTLHAACFMDVSPLVDLLSTHVAALVVDKEPHQLRMAFNLNNDLTEAEQQRARREHAAVCHVPWR